MRRPEILFSRDKTSLELRGGGSLTSVEADARHVLIRVESRPLVETIGEIGPRLVLHARNPTARRGKDRWDRIRRRGIGVFAATRRARLSRAISAGSCWPVSRPCAGISIRWGDPAGERGGGWGSSRVCRRREIYGHGVYALRVTHGATMVIEGKSIHHFPIEGSIPLQHQRATMM